MFYIVKFYLLIVYRGGYYFCSEMFRINFRGYPGLTHFDKRRVDVIVVARLESHSVMVV